MSFTTSPFLLAALLGAAPAAPTQAAPAPPTPAAPAAPAQAAPAVPPQAGPAAFGSAATLPAAPAAVPLGVDEAVQRALESSPRLARLAALETAARAQRRGAEAERWPQVDVAAGYTRRSNVPELTISTPSADPATPPRSITVFPNIPDNSRLRAGMALPLYTGGRIEGALAAAARGLEAAEQDLRGARAELVFETKAAYWSLVTARESLRVLGEAIRAYDLHLRDARNRERFGMAARNEVLAVQVERDRVELDRLRAEEAAELAQANLQRLLDLPQATRVDPTEPLAAAPLLPQAPAASGSQEPSGAGEGPTDAAVEAVPIEPLVAEAAASRAERAALAARAAAADALTRVERGARRPQLALSGGYSYANPNRDIVPPTAEWKGTWDVGVGLSWNVLDFGRRSASQARSQAQADAARAQLRELDRAIRLEVTQRALELRTARARVRVAAHAVESALENRRVAGDRYREGVIPSAELLDAELAHERAALARTEALAALRVATAGLDKALGR